MPHRDTAFVGRDPERAEVAALLHRPGPALTTLLGPPGVGKTRLAVEIAREQQALGAFPDGVHFVDLGAIDTPDALASAIAASLGDDAPSDAAALDRIAALLAGKEALVVLDNAEHLADDGQAFARLVAGVRDASFLVTSRVRLGLEAERVYRVTGLRYPEDDDVTLEDASAFGAVDLFVRRAERTTPGFVATEENLPAVLAICRRVEGLPLALELAAAWVRALTPREIAAELDERLELLATGAQDVPERHRSLLGAFEHAWALAGPRDRELLRRLSVCRGGFRRDAAAEIAGATLTDLAGLIDRSLLRTDGLGRYGAHPLLLELARLKASRHESERADTRRRHARAYLALLASWEDDLAGGDQERAVAAVGEDLENVRAAWRQAARTGDRAALWRACRALQIFYIQRGGRWDDAASAFGEAAEALERSDPSAKAVTGRLRAAEAWFVYRLGDLDRSEALAGVALARLGPLAAADPPDPTLDRALASTLNTLGNVASARGERQGAAARFEEVLALARRRGHEPQIAIASHNLGSVRSRLGDVAGAEALFREALAINRNRGNRRSMVRNLINLGTNALRGGDPEAAETALGEGLELARAIGFGALVPTLLSYLGHAAYARGMHARALELNEQALAVLDPHGDPGLVAAIRVGLADAAAALGRPDAARADYLRALQIAWPRSRVDTCAACLVGLAELHLAAGEPERAAHLVGLAGGLGPFEPETAERLRAARAALRDALPADRLERRLAEAARGSIGALLEPVGARSADEAP
ncbi:MAG: tetratricopeptide repeat protein [Trueperaceae bacterium]|nr:tetratricopeptide repeat protein [Trueperaceae bacterium]